MRWKQCALGGHGERAATSADTLLPLPNKTKKLSPTLASITSWPDRQQLVVVVVVIAAEVTENIFAKQAYTWRLASLSLSSWVASVSE